MCVVMLAGVVGKKPLGVRTSGGAIVVAGNTVVVHGIMTVVAAIVVILPGRVTVTAGRALVTAGIVTVVAAMVRVVVLAQAPKAMTIRSSARNKAINNPVFIVSSLKLLSCINQVVV